MSDDELRDRLGRIDPTVGGPEPEPVTSATTRRFLEAIMTTPTDTSTPGTTGVPDAPTHDLGARRRGRWSAGVLAAAAAAVAVVAGGATVAITALGGDDPEPTIADGDVLALSTGDIDPTLMSCLAPSPEIIAEAPVAFRATATAVDGESVTLEVDTWYRGGDADFVELTAPAGMEALIGGIDFQEGGAYLVTAYDGVVNYCGMSGPATPELQSLFDAAFPG